MSSFNFYPFLGSPVGWKPFVLSGFWTFFLEKYHRFKLVIQTWRNEIRLSPNEIVTLFYIVILPIYIYISSDWSGYRTPNNKTPHVTKLPMQQKTENKKAQGPKNDKNPKKVELNKFLKNLGLKRCVWTISRFGCFKTVSLLWYFS